MPEEITATKAEALKEQDIMAQREIRQTIAKLRSRYPDVDIAATMDSLRSMFSECDAEDELKEPALKALEYFKDIPYTSELMALIYKAAIDETETRTSVEKPDLPAEDVVKQRKRFLVYHFDVAFRRYPFNNPAGFLGATTEILGSICGWHIDVNSAYTQTEAMEYWESMIISKSHWWQQSPQAKQAILNNWQKAGGRDFIAFRDTVKQSDREYFMGDLKQELAKDEEYSRTIVKDSVEKIINGFDTLPVPYILPLFIEKLLAVMQERFAREESIISQLQQLATTIYKVSSFESAYVTISRVLIQIALLPDGITLFNEKRSLFAEILTDDGAQLQEQLIKQIAKVTEEERTKILATFKAADYQELQDCYAAERVRTVDDENCIELLREVNDLVAEAKYGLAESILYAMLISEASSQKREIAQLKICDGLLASARIEDVDMAVNTLVRIVRRKDLDLTPWASSLLMSRMESFALQGRIDFSRRIVQELVATEDVAIIFGLIEAMKTCRSSRNRDKKVLARTIMVELAQKEITDQELVDLLVEIIENHDKKYELQMVLGLLIPVMIIGFLAAIGLSSVWSAAAPFLLGSNVFVSIFLCIYLSYKFYRLPADLRKIINPPELNHSEIVVDRNIRGILSLQYLLSTAVFEVINRNLHISMFSEEHSDYLEKLIKGYVSSRHRFKSIFGVETVVYALFANSEKANKWAKKIVRKLSQSVLSKPKRFTVGIMLATTLERASATGATDLYDWSKARFVQYASSWRYQDTAIMVLVHLAERKSEALHDVVDAISSERLKALVRKIERRASRDEVRDWARNSLEAIQETKQLPFFSIKDDVASESQAQGSHAQITSLLDYVPPKDTVAERSDETQRLPVSQELSHASTWQTTRQDELARETSDSVAYHPSL